METEGHIELISFERGVFFRIFEGSRIHFSDREYFRILSKRFRVEFPEEFMNSWPIGKKAAAVPFIVVFVPGFGNQVDDIKTEAFYALFHPVVDDVRAFFSDLWVFPVEIRLLHIKDMQIIAVEFRNVFPGGTAEFAGPVGRLMTIFSFSENIVVLIFLISAKGFLKPFVLVGRVVEDHVHHDADASFIRFADQFLEVFHRSIFRIDGAVISHIIAVVAFR